MVAAVLCVLLVAPDPGVVARSQAPEPDLIFRDCLLTGANFEDDPERLVSEGWVPADYPPHAIVPGNATVTIWIMRCADATRDGTSLGSIGLGLLGAATTPGVMLDPTTWARVLQPIGGPMNWGIYVVAAHTDSGEVAADHEVIPMIHLTRE